MSEAVPWANFRTHKGGIKIHTLYDVETQVPAFVHITEAKINDVKAMDVIPYESGSFYVFDRAYNDYHRLYKIHMMDSFFVVRAKQILRRKYSNGNDVCLRIYCPTVRLNLPVSIPKNHILKRFV